MKRHTLFEHQFIPFAWDDNHLRSLARLNGTLGIEVLRATTWRGQRIIRSSSYVGTVRLGRDTFQILPKIDYGSDTEGSATRNLLYLLELAGNIPVRQHATAPFLAHGRDWFELLTHLFARDLLTQWQHGAYHHYLEVEETAVSLKGKWRIAQQLRYPARQHRFDVTYDEFSADNQLNRVLRYVVELLYRQTADGENRRMLGTLRHYLGDVTLLPYVSAEMASPTLITRLNRRYEPVLNLARLFLQSGTLEMSAGKLTSFAFVFDMDLLFEAFIIRLIERQRHQILPDRLQDCTLHPQTRHHSRFLATTSGGQGVFRLRPDLAMRRGDAYPLLLDTKYRKLAGDGRKAGVSQSDFYQMFAYSQRYRCPHVLLLYPQWERPLRVQFLLPDGQGIISAATIDLRRDLRSGAGRLALILELNEVLHIEVNHDSTA